VLVIVLDPVPSGGYVDVGDHLALLEPGYELDRCLAVLAHGIAAWFDTAQNGSAHWQEPGYEGHTGIIGPSAPEPEKRPLVT
jgi:hypothetical protein